MQVYASNTLAIKKDQLEAEIKNIKQAIRNYANAKTEQEIANAWESLMGIIEE